MESKDFKDETSLPLEDVVSAPVEEKADGKKPKKEKEKKDKKDKKSKKDKSAEEAKAEEPVAAQTDEAKPAEEVAAASTDEAKPVDGVAAEERSIYDSVASLIDDNGFLQDSAAAVDNADSAKDSAASNDDGSLTKDSAADTYVDNYGKVAKKKDKKSKNVKSSGAKSAANIERKEKVGGYITSLLKYFNIITILPITCIFYVIFFASDIVDGIEFVRSNKLMVIVMTSLLAAMLIIWMIDNRKKRRVCSLDAFLLISLLLCFGLILQCVILKHFETFDETAILTVAVTVFVLVLLTIRLIMYKHKEQGKNDDARYEAKSQIGMYLKVIFSKYTLFISTLCMVGILLILIVTKSEMLEKFEYDASTTEKVVTMAFAAVALVLMVIGLFIRIVRGRANIVDCMPYIFILFAIGTMINFFIDKLWMMLYISLGSGIIGVIWLALCQYTFYRKYYQKVEGAEAVEEEPIEEAPKKEKKKKDKKKKEEPIVEPIAETQPVEEQPVEPVTEEQPVEEVKAEEPAPVEETPVVEEVAEPIAEEQPVEEEKAEEPAPVEELAPIEEVKEEKVEEPAPVVVPVVEEVEEAEEAVEEEDGDGDGDEEEEEEEIATASIKPRFDFSTKMKLASDDIKNFYSEIKNEFYSYSLRSRISKTKENFTKGRDVIARIVINGKTMKLYLALDPKTLDTKYFHHKDVSEKKAFVDIPTMLPIRSKQSVSRAKELIAMLADKVGVLKKARYKAADFSEDLSAADLTLTARKGYGYMIRSEVKFEDVEQLPDDFAELLADISMEGSHYSSRVIKTTVSLDELVSHFEDGDIVTIDTVRECGIGNSNANYLIVEDGTKINKKLKVYADEITINALKMIALSGGEVYKIWRKV